MSLISRMRKQKAVYWEQTTANEFGQLGYAAPVQVECRWDDAIVEFIAKDGTTKRSRSVVYVDRDMKTGDMLKLGALVDVLSELDSGTDPVPSSFRDVWEIQRFDKNPNLKNTESLRTAYL